MYYNKRLSGFLWHMEQMEYDRFLRCRNDLNLIIGYSSSPLQDFVLLFHNLNDILKRELTLWG